MSCEIQLILFVLTVDVNIPFYGTYRSIVTTWQLEGYRIANPSSRQFPLFSPLWGAAALELGCRGNETKRNGQMMGVSTASQYRGICEESSKTNYPDEVLKHLRVGQTVGGFHSSCFCLTPLWKITKGKKRPSSFGTQCVRTTDKQFLKEVAHEQPRYWTVPVSNDVIILV